jgi:protease I
MMLLIAVKNNILLTIMIALLLLLASSGADAQIREKKILMIIPLRDFWCEELQKPRKIFEQSGLLVTVASSAMKEARSIFGVTVKPDIVLNQVKVDHYDAIVFVGGEGAIQYWDDPSVHRLIRGALKKGKVLGAMSVAPLTLANAKVLLGKKATVWPTLGNRLQWAGAIYTGEPVEIDGKIVTADRPGSAEEFAKAILRTIFQE